MIVNLFRLIWSKQNYHLTKLIITTVLSLLALTSLTGCKTKEVVSTEVETSIETFNKSLSVAASIEESIKTRYQPNQ